MVRSAADVERARHSPGDADGAKLSGGVEDQVHPLRGGEMKYWFVAVMALSAMAMPRHAAAQSALEMASSCKPIDSIEVRDNGVVTLPKDPRAYECWGAFSAIQQLGIRGPKPPQTFLLTCLPAQSTRIQLIKVFLRYAEDHPELGHRDYAGVAVQSLWEAFPCPAAPAPTRKR